MEALIEHVRMLGGKTGRQIHRLARFRAFGHNLLLTMRQNMLALRMAMVVLTCGLAFARPDMASAQEAADPSEWSKYFFDTLMTKGVDASFKIVREDTYLGQLVRGRLDLIRDPAEQAISTYGTIVNYELAREEKAGSTVIRQTYLVNHLRWALSYALVFYRTPRGWNLVNMTINDKIDGMPFTESAGKRSTP